MIVELSVRAATPAKVLKSSHEPQNNDDDDVNLNWAVTI